jgi:gas vesicle protein
MSQNDGANASGVILAFLLGGLTGAALAILYAPRSGQETRDLLGEKIREGAERGRQLKDRATERGRELLDEASDYMDRQKEGMERRRDRIAAAVEAGRQAFREEKEKM